MVEARVLVRARAVGAVRARVPGGARLLQQQPCGVASHARLHGGQRPLQRQEPDQTLLPTPKQRPPYRRLVQSQQAPPLLQWHPRQALMLERMPARRVQ